jgi:hypothetical protein
VFLYSEQQKALAGKDGEIAFNDVFARDARTVVVLYRVGWGQTPWTRIEETAIRNRGFDEGYDFATLVAIESPVDPPKWLPKNRLWVGFDRWGIEGAAATIEGRVQETHGTVEQQTELDRILVEEASKQEHTDFVEATGSVPIAEEEFRILKAELLSLVAAASARLPNLKLAPVEEHNGRLISLYGATHEVHISWSQQYLNTLRHSGLLIRSFTRPRRSQSYPLIDRHFEITMHSGRLGWREDGESAVVGSQPLAERCLADFLRLLLGPN